MAGSDEPVTDESGGAAPSTPIVRLPRRALYDDDLGRAELRVLSVVIADCDGTLPDRPGGKAVSQLTNEEIAAVSGVSVASVTRSVSKLAQAGYLARTFERTPWGPRRCLRSVDAAASPPD